jgi:predicted DNA-binding protein with PD1-like motif
MYHVQTKVGPAHVLKPAFKTDLLAELQSFIQREGINLAWISGIGAVGRATLRYYDQGGQFWHDIDLDEPLEVVSMMGNVSLLNGQPRAHVHIVLANQEGRCYAGHLAEGTVVFNMEILMTTMSGPTVSRRMDSDTGLTVWSQG